MKNNTFLITGLFFVVLLLFACGGRINDNHKMSREEYINTLDSITCSNSLVFWISDTAFSTNAKLMVLLDTLYQHVRTDSFASDVKKEEKWMTEYRSKLCAFYDSHRLGCDTISDYAKADSVLNEGARLVELDGDWSTMGTIVKNSVKLTFDRCREYGLLSQVINGCENQEAKEVVFKEWSLYELVLDKMMTMAADMVNLNYWGGSITGPLRTGAYLEVSQTRREMYQKIVDMIEDDSWDATGVYLNYAEKLFYDCSQETLRLLVDDAIQEDFLTNEQRRMYDETVQETQTVIIEMRPLTKEWVGAVREMGKGLLSIGDNDQYVERAASYMLIKWASIVSRPM